MSQGELVDSLSSEEEDSIEPLVALLDLLGRLLGHASDLVEVLGVDLNPLDLTLLLDGLLADSATQILLRAEALCVLLRRRRKVSRFDVGEGSLGDVLTVTSDEGETSSSRVEGTRETQSDAVGSSCAPRARSVSARRRSRVLARMPAASQ